MSKNFDYSSCDVTKKMEVALKNAEKIGEGHNGVVFLLKDGSTVKFFRKHSAWEDESYILKRVQGSKFFPDVHEVRDNYIVREYVKGIRLDKYLKNNKMDAKLAKSLYDMIIEFEKLKFKRLDIRCKDIFYDTETKKIRIIDPKNNYAKKVSYPRHLMKGIDKKGQLDYFLKKVCEFDKKRGKIWSVKIERYLKYYTK